MTKQQLTLKLDDDTHVVIPLEPKYHLNVFNGKGTQHHQASLSDFSDEVLTEIALVYGRNLIARKREILESK